MGDRTHCQIEIAARDKETLAPVFDRWGFSEDEDYGSGDERRITYVDDEANYGGNACVAALIKRGKPFIGRHDSGGDYPAMRFAFDGENHAEVVDADGGIMCLVNDDGQVDAGSLATAREYLRVAKRAEQLIDGPDDIAPTEVTTV